MEVPSDLTGVIQQTPLLCSYPGYSFGILFLGLTDAIYLTNRDHIFDEFLPQGRFNFCTEFAHWKST